MDGFILCVGEFGGAERWKDGNRMMVPLRRVAVDDGVQQAVGIAVAAGDGQTVVITQLQPEGGKRMAADAYLLGHPIQV